VPQALGRAGMRGIQVVSQQSVEIESQPIR
jgi:hypothetical protein